MNVQDLIAARRDGRKQTQDELGWLAKAAATGEILDYQLAAWLMAAYCNPLDADETAWLTLGMAASGERLDLSSLPHPWVDKHSTGGVGDKTTLVLLPILAACGLTMVKMSGRGLGITGGTIDKLESVPGFRVDLTPEQMVRQAGEVGIALAEQSPQLAPADGVMYAMRDAIGAVESIPLIVSSILSKKLACGAELVSLDVKCGSGAFMKDRASADALAAALLETGRRCGLKTTAVVTDMSSPLGRTVGNAIEVKEAIRVLNGARGRFRDLCLMLARHTLEASGKEAAEAEKALDDGRALAKARAWFDAQGGDAGVFDDESLLPAAPCHSLGLASSGGTVLDIDAGAVGRACVRLGAGREKKGDKIDPSAGVEFAVDVGYSVDRGDPLFRVDGPNSAATGEAVAQILAAITVGTL